MHSTNGLKLVPLTKFQSDNGVLTPIQFDQILPFPPKRIFLINEVPAEGVRGRHAHKQCIQFLICINGGCDIWIDVGSKKSNLRLADGSEGLLVPPLTWLEISNFSPGAALLVIASDNYEEDDYIYDQRNLNKSN
jgi:hypothetical protein